MTRFTTILFLPFNLSPSSSVNLYHYLCVCCASHPSHPPWKLTIIQLGIEQKLWLSPSRSFLLRIVTSRLVSNIPHSAEFSNTFNTNSFLRSKNNIPSASNRNFAFLCFAGRASQQLTNLMHKFLFYNKFIICLYMFRALFCSSTGGQIVLYSIWYRHTR